MKEDVWRRLRSFLDLWSDCYESYAPWLLLDALSCTASQPISSCSAVRLCFVALSVGLANHPLESRTTHSAATTAATVIAKVTGAAAVECECGLAVGLHAVAGVPDGRVTCQ